MNVLIDWEQLVWAALLGQFALHAAQLRPGTARGSWVRLPPGSGSGVFLLSDYWGGHHGGVWRRLPLFSGLSVLPGTPLTWSPALLGPGGTETPAGLRPLRTGSGRLRLK